VLKIDQTKDGACCVARQLPELASYRACFLGNEEILDPHSPPPGSRGAFPASDTPTGADPIPTIALVGFHQ
jgi:hypothetical protein